MSEDNITQPLLEALFKAQSEVKPIAKSGRNDQGNFDYAPADAVIKYSRELLAKHGLGWIKTGQHMLPPKLLAGEIGRRSYVGEAEISGFIYHHESGGLLRIVSEIPVVAMSATPHDKAAAASSTFGAGYMHLGILNADRAGAHSQVSDRGDAPEAMCVGDAAPIATSNRERAEALAELGGTVRESVWDWACGKCDIPRDDGVYPGPKSLYISEGKRVGALLKVTLEGELAKRQASDPSAGGAS